MSAAHSLAGSAGGKERWSIKTGADADAARVDIAHPVQTTIAQLVALPLPKLPTAGRAAPVERTCYRVTCELVEVSIEADHDLHLVLRDAAGATMIGELPDPAAVDVRSPWHAAICAARAAFIQTFRPHATGWAQEHKTVVVVGVGFYDRVHGQTGVALPTGIEIHPVLGITPAT